ncbi:MAG TPA: hypothetical protein DDZ67_14705 [Xanthomonadaceae bacterium]|nr:hypothetical protein [Xanthomonadaceae bacterium]
MALPWWIWPAGLFALPLLAGLLINLFVRHRRGISSNVVLTWFVIVCWISALALILGKVL